MAMTIFLTLSGLGVFFLLYVLANFWNEGRRPNRNTRRSVSGFGRMDRADVIVVTHPISHSADGGLSVIPFPARERYSDNAARLTEAPAIKFSTR
jgi:hypothetical protein